MKIKRTIVARRIAGTALVIGSVLTCRAINECIQNPQYGTWLCWDGATLNTAGTLDWIAISIRAGQTITPPGELPVSIFNHGTKKLPITYLCSQPPSSELADLYYKAGALSFTAINPDGNFPATILGPFNNAGNYSYKAKANAIPTAIAGWWPGENVNDVILANNGQSVGSVISVQGQIGNAFSFTGANSGVRLGNLPQLHLQNFTIEAWVRRSNSSSSSYGTHGNGLFFGYGNGGYGFGVNDTGHLLLTRVDINNVTTTSAVLVDPSYYHHVAVTKSGTTVIFYLDGSVVQTFTGYNTSYTFNTVPSIGARGDTLNDTFKGSIDELAVHDTALSQAQIAAIISNGHADLPSPSSACAFTLPFEIGTVTINVVPAGTMFGWYVNKAIGNNNYSGRSPTVSGANGPYVTINKAIASSLAGDTIDVAAGNYSENVDLHGKNVTVTIHDTVVLH